MKIKLQDIKHTIGVDSLSVREGIYTARTGYFYRFGNDEDKIAATIIKKFPTAKIIDKGDHRTPFRGGSALAQSSH